MTQPAPEAAYRVRAYDTAAQLWWRDFRPSAGHLAQKCLELQAELDALRSGKIPGSQGGREENGGPSANPGAESPPRHDVAGEVSDAAGGSGVDRARVGDAGGDSVVPAAQLAPQSLAGALSAGTAASLELLRRHVAMGLAQVARLEAEGPRLLTKPGEAQVYVTGRQAAEQFVKAQLQSDETALRARSEGSALAELLRRIAKHEGGDGSVGIE